MIKFYKCSKCENIIFKIKEKNDKYCCCDILMQEVPLIYEENEKHSPVVIFNNDLMSISVGSVTHPMSMDHLIEWIFIEYSNGGEFIYLIVFLVES